MRQALIGIGVLALGLGGCQTTLPVNKPCGVIVDSLKDVAGKTPRDRARIDQHFERGVAAGCWKRADKPAAEAAYQRYLDGR
ncbi:MAG: hypothetical protein E6R03_12435 [Hyphomicrobiaceae bacterium]|nr:MAG: hypothetical protein E6R03_12435 [Hyphomicrobiaceae bacterium]